jgi:hypothetical protein
LEFVELNIQLPEKVRNIYEKINEIVPNSCIAGGCLCDLYMEKEYKDVDIFIKYCKPDKKKKIFELLEEELGYKQSMEVTMAEYGDNMEVYEYKKDETIQIIFNERGIKSVKYFDLRFREFFYFKGKAYASKEALKDIEEKRLVIGSSHSPLRTFYRIMKFEKKYHFTVDQPSLEKFKAVSTFRQTPSSYAKLYVKNVVKEKDISFKFHQIINKNSDYRGFMSFSTNLSRRELMTAKTVAYLYVYTREEYEKIWKNIFQEQNIISYSFSGNPFEKIHADLKEKVTKGFKSNRLEMIYRYSKPFMDKWESKIKVLTDEDYVPGKKINTWFQYALNFQDFDQPINQNVFFNQQNYPEFLTPFVFETISKFIEAKRKLRYFKNTVSITIVDGIVSVKDLVFINSKTLANGDYVTIQVENYGYFLYNKKMKKVIASRMNETIQSEIEEILIQNKWIS